MNNITLGDFCRLFCCPPRPSRVVAKFAFLPPAPSYNVVRHTHNRISSTSPNLSNGSGDNYHYPNDDGIRIYASSDNEPATSTSNAISTKKSSSPSHSLKPSSLSPRQSSDISRSGDTPVRQKTNGTETAHETWKLTINQPSEFELSPWARNRIEMFFTMTRARNRIACMYVPTDANPPSPYVILFSHGNAVDLGQMSNFLTSLAQTFGIHVFCYDYSGYGLSAGHPLESNLYADAEAMLQAVSQRYGYPLNRIVLYGQSIGTAPTVELASRYKVAGVVLHSALMSGIRVVCPGTTRRYCFDPFTNIDKVERIQSPTLVIHGEADEIITVEHGYQLFERLRNPVEPIWIEEAGHNDIESFPEYADRLARFLRYDLPQYWKDENVSSSEGPSSSQRPCGKRFVRKHRNQSDQQIQSQQSSSKTDNRNDSSYKSVPSRENSGSESTRFISSPRVKSSPPSVTDKSTSGGGALESTGSPTATPVGEETTRLVSSVSANSLNIPALPSNNSPTGPPTNVYSRHLSTQTDSEI